jgi:hypothetical protein
VTPSPWAPKSKIEAVLLTAGGAARPAAMTPAAVNAAPAVSAAPFPKNLRRSIARPVRNAAMVDKAMVDNQYGADIAARPWRYCVNCMAIFGMAIFGPWSGP